MKNPHNKHRKKDYVVKPNEVESQSAEITPEIIQDIDDMLNEALLRAKAKYPQAAGPIDKLINSLATAMADAIIENSSKTYDSPVELQEGKVVEESSGCEPVLPDYDKALDKMREMKEKKKYYEDDEDDDDSIESPVYEDKDDDDEEDYLPRLRSISSLNYESSATSSWYEVFYTLDKSGTEASVKVKADSKEDAESKVIMMIDEECTIEYVIEVEDNEDDDEDIPVIINSDDDDEYDTDDPNYSVMGSVYRHMKKKPYRG